MDALWAGPVRLFRLDDAGGEMLQVGEGDCLFDAEVRMPEARLVVSWQATKRRQISSPVASLSMQPTAGDSVAFYDEHGIYWALQLEQGGEHEALALVRAVLCATAAATGRPAALRLREPPEGAAGPSRGPARLRVRAAACHLEPGAGEAPLGPAASSELSAAEVEARWGPSAASALEPLAPGAAALVAVPQAGRTAAQDGARAAVILLDVEALAEEAGRPAPQPSIKERAAMLAGVGLPPGALQAPGACPPAPAAAGGRPAPAGGGEAGAGAAAHPSAEIIREYWAAVQEAGAPAPYAFLGSLPLVPGLSAPGAYGARALPADGARSVPSLGAFPVASAAPATRPPEPQQAPPWRAGADLPLDSTPVGSVPLRELVATLRSMVRAEATPEGQQAERQRLERRVALLEEQLRAARSHQEQQRQAQGAQLAALHSQLAEAQLVTRQMHEHSLRSQSDSQLRAWEQSAAQSTAEAELRQSRGEAQQLRLEAEGLRAALVEAEACQRRAQDEAASLSRQLGAASEARVKDAVSFCKSLMSVTYAAMMQALPEASDARVAAAEVAARLRAVCQQAGLASERELARLALHDAGRAAPPSLAEAVAWDAVERAAARGAAPPLGDLGDGGAAALEACAAERQSQIVGLEARIEASERRCAEAEGRAAERDARAAELQRRLGELQAAVEAERQRADKAARGAAETERARALLALRLAELEALLADRGARPRDGAPPAAQERRPEAQATPQGSGSDEEGWCSVDVGRAEHEAPGEAGALDAAPAAAASGGSGGAPVAEAEPPAEHALPPGPLPGAAPVAALLGGAAEAAVPPPDRQGREAPALASRAARAGEAAAEDAGAARPDAGRPATEDGDGGRPAPWATPHAPQLFDDDGEETATDAAAEETATDAAAERPAAVQPAVEAPPRSGGRQQPPAAAGSPPRPPAAAAPPEAEAPPAAALPAAPPAEASPAVARRPVAAPRASLFDGNSEDGAAARLAARPAAASLFGDDGEDDDVFSGGRQPTAGSKKSLFGGPRAAARNGQKATSLFDDDDDQLFG